jgi:hypothetical protein
VKAFRRHALYAFATHLYAKHACLCFLFLFIVYSSSQAQYKKGEVLLGGSISFLTQNLSPDDPTMAYALKNTTINFSPSIGWAIRDNLVEGVNLNVSYSNVRQSIVGGIPSNSTQKQQGYGIGYFIEHYNPLGKGFYLFVGGNLNGNYSHFTYVNNSDGSKIEDDKGYSLTVGFNPGVS